MDLTNCEMVHGNGGEESISYPSAIILVIFDYLILPGTTTSVVSEHKMTPLKFSTVFIFLQADSTLCGEALPVDLFATKI